MRANLIPTLAMTLWALPAAGQQRVADVTILVDQSHEMSKVLDANAADRCAQDPNMGEPGAGLESRDYLKSALMGVRDILAGRVVEAGRFCRLDDDRTPEEMCRQQSEPGGWLPCDEVDVRERDDSGWVRRDRAELNFHLFGMDTDAAAGDDDVGDDHGANNDVRQIAGGRPNLGIVSMEGAARDIVHGLRPAGDRGWVRGGAPITAMLRDLLHEYRRRRAAGDLLRKQVAVLITTGTEGWYRRGACNAGRCSSDGDADQEGRCEADKCWWPMELAFSAADDEDELDEKPAAVRFARAIGQEGATLFIVAIRPPEASLAALAEIAAASNPAAPGDEDTPGLFVVNEFDDLINALPAKISSFARAGIRSRARPLIVGPAPKDMEAIEDKYAPANFRFLQWRFTTAGEVVGGDSSAYGRVFSAERGCTTGQNERLAKELGAVKFEESVAAQEDRRAVTEVPALPDAQFHAGRHLEPGNVADDVRVVVGIQNLQPFLFKANCTENAADCTVADDADVRDEVEKMLLPIGVQGLPAAFRRAGLRVAGHFGDRGLPPENNDGEVGPRQLAEILTGDMVTIGLPTLGVESPSYQAFLTSERDDRATLLAVGARDGQLHVFRAVDGVELLTVAPTMGWSQMDDGGFAADGPLSTAVVRECMNLDAEEEGCAGELENFRVMIVGGSGTKSRSLYRVDVTHLKGDFTDPEDNANPALDLGAVFPADDNQTRQHIWNLSYGDVGGQLGTTVSRPVLTHVRNRERLVAAVVAGCGDDPDEQGWGHCVVVRDARDGSEIATITHDDMDEPMVGSPTVFSAGGLSAAQRIYLGDKVGRLWRIDLRDPRPERWEAAIAWPPPDLQGEALMGYPQGDGVGPVVGAPSIFRGQNGRVEVVYGHGQVDLEAEEAEGGLRRFIVSFTEVLLEDETTYEAQANWVFELKRAEYLSGEVVTRDEISYFTTIEDVSVGGATAQGRVYGVHGFKPNVNDDNEAEELDLGDGRVGAVRPELPLFGENGEPAGKALSLLLPPGRVPFGLAFVTTPSCLAGQPPATQIVLNLADETRGGAPVAANALRAEQVENGRLRVAALDGRIHAEKGGADTLALTLGADRDGNATSSSASRSGPIQSWGSTFTN